MAPQYVRKSRRGDWDRVDPSATDDLNFPASVLADILDNENEISVWEVGDPATPEELGRIAAALHNRGVSNLSDVTLRIISGWKIKDELKLSMSQTRGESLDSQLNSAGKHWVVKIDTVGDSIRFAKALKAQDPIFLGKSDVMQSMASSIAGGRIKYESVSGTLVKKLFDDGHLQFVAKKTDTPTTPPSSDIPATANKSN